METSDAYQKLATKALERSNKENAVLNQWVGKLNSGAAGLTEEMECVREEAQSAGKYVVKQYTAMFNLIKSIRASTDIEGSLLTSRWRNRLRYTQFSTPQS